MTANKREGWLTVGQAAEWLGVHATTLRRWADDGEIPVFLTPGGHRRFVSADLERFSNERRRLRMLAGLEQIWARQALDRTRVEIVRNPEAGWLTAFDEDDREQKRALGRRLMGLMLRYVSLEEGGEELLQEARLIGRGYAESARGLDLPLSVPLQATMFFRDAILETALELPERVHVEPSSSVRLLRRLNALLNAVQLAVVEIYEEQP